MKKILSKILFLFLILFGINLVIQNTVIPYYWGDEVLNTKITWYEDHMDAYNTVMIGGSLLYRHTDPVIFDSLNRAHGIPTSTFNFGVDGNNHPKQMVLVNRLLKKHPDSLKYMFINLSSDSEFERSNKDSRKFITWINLPSVFYSINLAWGSNYPLGEKLDLSWQYVIAWVKNKLNAGMGMYLVKYAKKDPAQARDLSYIGKDLNGFLPYFYPEGVDSADLSGTDQILWWTNQWYYRNLKKADSITEVSRTEFRNYKPGELHLNKNMLNSYLGLIKKAQEKGIEVYVVIPPRLRQSYNIFLPVYEELPAEHKLNLGNPDEYPEFYSHDNSFNFYHMNAKGAALFSVALSQEWLRLKGKDVTFYPPVSTEPPVPTEELP